VQPFVAAMFSALGATAVERSGEDFGKLARDHSTPGGLNEQALRELKAAGWTDLVSQTLDLILARTQGRATLADKLPINR
jgi:pyrroline-5-carboxylate reductase